ncbi:MAG: CDP-alcohol phosphatidyltransferase [Chloroflexi bacterium]|nr:CDP-alcohol phosphatidyltransferase [Chloroflexota bacterium]
MSELKSHTRVNDILLGPLERPALQWSAAHMPAWVKPDHLTALGSVGAVVVLIAYGSSNGNLVFLWLATLGLFINWFGDSMDGTLARYRHIERPKYGFFVDHTVDALNIVVIVLGIALSPLISFEIATFVLVGYLLMSILVYIETYIEGKFKISYGKLGPTEMRALIVIINTYAFFFGIPYVEIASSTLNLLDVLAGAVGVALFGIYIVSVFRGARTLAQAE